MASRFRTTDLTLATFLIVRGHRPELIREGESGAGHPVGVWVFEDGEGIKQLVDEFNRGDACVEPKKLHSALTATRRELFAFLKIA